MTDAITTLTTTDELDAFIVASASLIEAGELFVRWSHGPERDAANGFVSRNWAQEGDEEYEGEGFYDGLCASMVSEPTIRDIQIVARAYEGQVHGNVAYILAGRVCGECPDGEPIVEYVEPLAIIAPAALV